MRREQKNPKLKKFGKLAEQIQALGFESMFIVAVEKNNGSKKTYLSTKHIDKDQEMEFDKTVIKLVSILGTTPKELKASLEGLYAVSDAGQLRQFITEIDRAREELREEQEEEKKIKKKPKKKKKKMPGWEQALREHTNAEVRTLTFSLNEILGMPTATTALRSRRTSRKEEMEAELKLTPEQRVKLEEIRGKKNNAVRARQYEEAAKYRDEEKQLLGLTSGGTMMWTTTNQPEE